MTLRLEPLGDEDVDELIPERIPGELREKIARAAGGNPLFIEEMLAMAGEAGWTWSCRRRCRRCSRRAWISSRRPSGACSSGARSRGRSSTAAPCRRSHPTRPQVTPRLAALVRKELIRPDRPQLPGEDAFRFRHLLIRDAAYDALPKATRADLHERFASWLEEHGTELVELDEILGYHLEQACRYRAELGMPPTTAAWPRRRGAA